MNIHAFYARISPWFRRRRMRQFFERVGPRKSDRILDVGGYPQTWTSWPPTARQIDVLNIHPIQWDSGNDNLDHRIRLVIGDGCNLEYPAGSYDIVFSNSVIEHVGSWENQKRFAAEARRVGGRLWIQTPARSFFLEPHYLAPFVHWLPKAWQRRMLRRFTPWGWMTKPSRERVDAMIAEIRLLSLGEMRELFPDCEILRERFLGLFTKSYTAYRPEPARNSKTEAMPAAKQRDTSGLEPAPAAG